MNNQYIYPYTPPSQLNSSYALRYNYIVTYEGGEEIIEANSFANVSGTLQLYLNGMAIASFAPGVWKSIRAQSQENKKV